MTSRPEAPLVRHIDLIADDQPVRQGGVNMAIDQLLLTDLQNPWLRFYGWEEPTISIGYFGAIPDSDGRPVVRRWTGGGLVEHGGEQDYTFSLGVPAASGEPMMRPSESYHRIHVALLSVLRRLGIEAELVSQGTPGSTTAGGACFVHPVEADIVSSSTGEKLVGGAQRRSKSGMLHQGSIHGVNLPADVATMFAEALSGNMRTLPIADDIVDRATALASARYPDL